LKKTGRNDPCPCGSGKKYKQCCYSKGTTEADNTSEHVSVADALKVAMQHHQSGRLQQADAIYQQILQVEPNNPDALHLLGLLAREAGEIELAIELIGKAITVKPSAPMFYNLGITLQGNGNYDDAVENYKNAITMNPEYSEAYENLAILFQSQGQHSEAVKYYQSALTLKQNDSALLANLGTALQATGNIEGAIESYKKALVMKPDDPVIYNNLGNALAVQGEYELAEESFNKALSVSPEYAGAFNNLGNALRDQGKHERAIDCFRKALQINPDYHEALWNESMALLSLGRLEEGWNKYQWRLQTPAQLLDDRGFTQPQYKGEDITDKTILLWAEQGVGDEVHFANVLPDIIKIAGHCIIECDQRLVSLYARSFPDAEVIPKCSPAHERSRQPDIDVQCSVASLPQWFRRSISDFPNHNGYLVADKERSEFWRRRLNDLGDGFKVGISWRSMHRNSSRNLYYTDLVQWHEILKTSGVVFVNLQYDDCRDEIEEIKKLHKVDIHIWEDLDLLNDLDEAAALTAALDHVIAPCTSVFAMAGALGQSAWMLNLENDMSTLGTDNIPWYPQTRLFCKSLNQDWDVVMDKVASELVHLRDDTAANED